MWPPEPELSRTRGPHPATTPSPRRAQTPLAVRSRLRDPLHSTEAPRRRCLLPRTCSAPAAATCTWQRAIFSALCATVAPTIPPGAASDFQWRRRGRLSMETAVDPQRPSMMRHHAPLHALYSCRSKPPRPRETWPRDDEGPPAVQEHASSTAAGRRASAGRSLLLLLDALPAVRAEGRHPFAAARWRARRRSLLARQRRRTKGAA